MPRPHIQHHRHSKSTKSRKINNNVSNHKSRSSMLLLPFWLLLMVFLTLTSQTYADVLQLDDGNIDQTLSSHELVIANFYADWCRFSQNLKPTFLETSNKLKDKPEVLFAGVDCEKQAEIAQKYHVNKYPTIKFFRFGELIKKEYRGQRSVEAIEEFVRKQLQSPVQPFVDQADLDKRLDAVRRNVIAYFTNSHVQPQLLGNFYKAASALREDCAFWLATDVRDVPGPPGDGQQMQAAVNATIFFRDPQQQQKDGGGDFRFTGPLEDYDYLKQWLTDKCVPLVREITFENAEELTEEGLPFLILFRQLSDAESERLFTSVVTSELADQKTAMNFLTADGKRFAHPLQHLGKSERDLPLIAIDSFRHMYLFPSFEKVGERGQLRQFVLDLHSGKLHREFHQGPDPTKPNQELSKTQPPPSVFNKLKPAENRYSLLDKTEL